MLAHRDPAVRLRARCAQPKLASRENRTSTGERAFVHSLQVRNPHQESTLACAALASARLEGGINTYAYALNRPTMLTDPTGLGPVLALACTVANGAYQIHNFNSTASDLSQNTDLLRDQLNRVNDRISECGPNDGEKKANLLQMRADLTREIVSGIGQSVGAGDSGHVDVAQGLIVEGVCGLLLLVGP